MKNRILTWDGPFYKKLILLTAPLAFQNLIASLLNMVDTMMIGQIGEVAIGGVGLANRYFFLMNLFWFGTYSGAAIFISQYYGKKDFEGIKKVAALALVLGVLPTLFVVFSAIAFPMQMMRVFTNEKEIIKVGASYLRIIGISYLFSAITFAFTFSLRAISNVRLSLIVSFFALMSNTFLNYVLIFGKFNMPKLGVEGAAYATVFARILEMFVLVYIIYRNKMPVAVSIKHFKSVNKEFIKKYFKTTLPVLINEVFWSVGVTVYAMVYGRLGMNAVASVNIVETIQRFGMVIFFGMGQACLVIIGQTIGEGKSHLADIYAKRFIVFAPIMGIFIGFLLYLSSGTILQFFKVEDEVIRLCHTLIMIFSIFIPIKVVNIMVIVGILRGGGDTKYSMKLDVAAVWLVGVPLVAISGLVFSLPVTLVYLASMFEEVFKCVFSIKRVLGKKWINLVA